MCDVPKNVSTDDAHVVHGRTHNQAELQESRPLKLGGLRVLISLAVSIFFGVLIFHLGLLKPRADVISIWFMGVVATVVWLFVGLLLTGGRYPAIWLRQYWQRNVRGYAVAYWLDDQGKLVGRISTRLPPPYRWMSGRSPTIYLPLGGWLHRPRFADHNSNLHEHGVRVRWPWFEPTPDKVWVSDRDGARAKLWVHDALVLWGPRHLRGLQHYWFDHCYIMLRDIERLERDHATALALLLDVHDRIVATKRFIKSTQAQAIAHDLRQKLSGLLPYDHPRSREFAKAPTAKAAPVTAKT